MEENLDINDFDSKTCKIIDAKHHEEVGTDDNPFYSQSIRLLLQDVETGATFVAPLSENDLKDICHLDFDLHSKDMIEIAEKLRNWESDVRLLVPKKNNAKINKNLILNTPDQGSNENISFRQTSVKRFQFNKEKYKKG